MNAACVEPSGAGHTLVAERLEKSYRNRKVVDGVSIHIDQGEIVGPGGTDEAIALLRRHAARVAAFDSLVVPGNHWYMGAERQAAEGIAQWMATRCLAATVQEDANEDRH